MSAPQGRASLWYWTTPAPAARRDRYLAWLSADELARYRRFRFEPDRQVFLAAHALVRCALGRCAGVEPETLEFDISERGKPFVRRGTPAADWHFNLSHTRGLVACAASRAGALGVDVERIDGRRDLRGLARRVLSPAEYDDWDACSGAARSERFFRYWTLKEAFIKALGLGLDQPLQSLTFTLAADGSATLSGRPDAARWNLRTFAPLAGYLISLALPAAVTAPVSLHRSAG